MDDFHCVEAALAGDDGALKTLHDRYVDHIFQYAYMSANNYHDAEEITQDVFLKMARALHTFRGDSSFKTWLFKISRHCVIDYYKKNKNNKSEALMEMASAEEYSIEKAIVDKSEFDELVMCMRELSIDQQTVIHCRYIEELTIKETAAVINKSSLSVKALQHRARKALRKRMAERGSDRDA